MKAWEVLAIAKDGEYVCWDCMDAHEHEVASDREQDDDISPLFASNVEQEETCDRCGQVIEGTEQSEEDDDETPD